MVIGAKGRCGRGALSVATQLGLPVTAWDIEETKAGGPFPEILEHDIFINCVYIDREISPFLTRDLIAQQGRRLSVICDVSCDPASELNPLPIYSDCSSFADPCQRLVGGRVPLDLIAIDHLPSLLPAESSRDFSSQLLPFLLDLREDRAGAWARARQRFTEKLATIQT